MNSSFLRHSGARAERVSPESITTTGSMDSGPAPRGASTMCNCTSGNDEGEANLRRALQRQHTAANLVFLDRFEQRLEIAFAKAVVALALDELEEDRPDGVGGKNLQQHLGMAALDHAFAVDQNPVTLEPCDVLAVFRQPRVDLLEIGFGRRRHEGQAVGAQALDGAVDVLGAAGDVLDALAAIDAEIFLD